VLALLVVNPQATATTPAGRDVLAHALASDVKLEILETSHRGHAAEAAAQAARDGFDLVVAHGGDGTVNEVVNGLLSATDAQTPMLGVVPGGSANVFAGALGLPRDPVEATHRLLQAIETGRSRTIGLGKVNLGGVKQRWFTFNAGIGWDAEVVAAVERRRSKEASPTLYLRTAVTQYVRQLRSGPELTVELAGEPPVTGVRLAFVCNTDPWTYLGDKPLHLIPGCSFDSGLGLFALRSLGAGTIARHAGQMLRGASHPKGRNLLFRDDEPHIRVTSAKPVRVQVDGDLLGEQNEVEFISVPDALRVAL
jgi:diacylglycerol kinase family enzyme